MLDNDALAVEAAGRNVRRAGAILGDGLESVSGKRYDLIISNPPIHRGKDKDFSLLADLLVAARRYLSPSGSLRFVVQRTAPVARLVGKTTADADVIAENTRFRVWNVRYPRM